MSFKSAMERAVAYSQQQGELTPPIVPVLPVGPQTAGLATPAVLTQIQDAVDQGKGLWEVIQGIFNPREAEARRAAEIARLAAEDASRTVPTVVPAEIAVGQVIPLALAAVAAFLLLSSRR